MLLCPQGWQSLQVALCSDGSYIYLLKLNCPCKPFNLTSLPIFLFKSEPQWQCYYKNWIITILNGFVFNWSWLSYIMKNCQLEFMAWETSKREKKKSVPAWLPWYHCASICNPIESTVYLQTHLFRKSLYGPESWASVRKFSARKWCQGKPGPLSLVALKRMRSAYVLNKTSAFLTTKDIIIHRNVLWKLRDLFYKNMWIYCV